MSNRLPPDEYTILCRYVYRRDKWKCRCCGRREGLHAHHIVYRSQGGLDRTENLITLCFQCHDKVHAHKIVLLPMTGYAAINANGIIRFEIVGLGIYPA